ncbi:hypothetical protein [Ktedonospora formicarum]|uniref:Uncharacterized protein n=1 Tax=Ktedonospora formicarum TaxID=2778364 RepID=A0A8J3IAF8_9CHLR|nr:hypothetical protein [Ktedonospora formicarum]GHO49740.1 hypothetical protein KSX_79030 [Ktedonospora formicarum]
MGDSQQYDPTDFQQRFPTDEEWAGLVKVISPETDTSEIAAFIAAMPEEMAKAYLLSLLVSGGCVGGDVLFVDFVRQIPH